MGESGFDNDLHTFIYIVVHGMILVLAYFITK